MTEPVRRQSLSWMRAGVAIALVLGSCQSAVPSPPSSAPPSAELSAASVSDAAAQVTPELLREHVAGLSADALAGRGPGTPGDELARGYLARQLHALGLEPGAGTAGWEQPFELIGIKAAMPKSWRFERGKQALDLTWSEQYIAGSGGQTPRVALEAAEVVFVGYGIQAPEYGWDDFKGRDLRGKLLLFLNNDPDWDPTLFAGKTRLYYGRWTYKYEIAARQGAAGALIVHTKESAGYPFQVVQSSWGGRVYELPSAVASPLKVKGWLTEDAATALAALAGQNLPALTQAAKSRDFSPVSLGVSSSLTFENDVERVKTANVYGVIKGSDPKVAGQYVVLSAHHDHLGTGKPDQSGDAVYNGALDNAAGNATVLAIARAVQALKVKPRRSVLVLFPGAEEQNLLGSKFFVEHSPVPVAQLAAIINYDGGNIWGKTRDLSQVGYGKSSVDDVVRAEAQKQGRVVKPDEFPDRGSFYRSDQLNFARAGVPAVYLKTGTDFVGRPEGWGRQQILSYEANHYHQPSDELSADWTFDGMVEDTQLGFFVTLALANAEQAPRWLPGDEFEAARR